MINLDGIANVQRRIAEIQQHFGNPENLIGVDFQSRLRQEMEKMQNAAKVEPTAKTDKIAAQTATNDAAKIVAPKNETAQAGLNNNGNNTDIPFNGTSPAFDENKTNPIAYDDVPVKDAQGKQVSADKGEISRLITEAAEKYGVDSRLVSAIASAESNNDQSVVSPAGAVGVMQLMPSTAAELGVNPYDVKGNIDGGAKYIKKMLDSFGGDVTKAIAAYNAGPNAVKNYGGVPPYGETMQYVDKVLDLYR